MPENAKKPIVLKPWEMKLDRETRGRELDRYHNVAECRSYKTFSERKKK